MREEIDVRSGGKNKNWIDIGYCQIIYDDNLCFYFVKIYYRLTVIGQREREGGDGGHWGLVFKNELEE